MPAATVLFQPYASRHEAPKGPGDGRPTALDIIKDEDAAGKLRDHVILITGCSAGLGIETARALHLTGAKLYLTVRDMKKGEAIAKEITTDTPGTQPIDLVHMDLGNLASVRSAAQDFLSRSDKLNILINNAGVMAAPEGRTADGFETHLGTNHFGHFLFFQLLKPLLLSSSSPESPSRVIMVSSSGHRLSGIRFHDLNFSKEPYNHWAAYGQSKTANIYMANSIERHYGARGLRGLSLHPGVILTTGLMRHVPESELQSIGTPEYFHGIEQSPEQGAATTVFAAVSPYFKNRGGLYLADVGEAPPAAEGEPIGTAGYGDHAYDEEAEEKLWNLSYEAVGLAQGSMKI